MSEPLAEFQADPRFAPALAETEAALADPAAHAALRADPYWPKWEGPWWRILLLVELGLPARVPAAALEALVEGYQTRYLREFPLREEELPAGIDPYREIPCHCQLGCVLSALAACGVDPDARLPWVRPWLLRYQLPDGGLNCDEAVYTRAAPHSSVVSTVPALEGILRATPGELPAAKAEFLARGLDYLSSRRLWRSLSRGGAIMDPSWAQPAFPRYYEFDLLRGASLLLAGSRRLGRPLPLEALREAREALAAHADGPGRLRRGRRAWEGAGSIRPDAGGVWQRRQPARTFPLLELVSELGVRCPVLSREWEALEAALA